MEQQNPPPGYGPYHQQPPTVPGPPVKVKSKLTAPIWLIAVVASLIGLCCIGGGIAVVVGIAGTETDPPGDGRPIIEDDAPAAPAAEDPDDGPIYFDPKPKDFELTVKVLSKECFGSAGCIVDFRIELGYATTGMLLDPDVTYEVIYEVTGGEEEYINTLTVTGDQYSVDETEYMDTPSDDAELVATVTDVSER